MKNLKEIPDINFRNRLKRLFTEAFENELLDINNGKVASCKRLSLYNLNIKDLTGIEYFVNLKYLYCFENSLTSLSNLPDTLEYLDCRNNQLISLPKLPDTLNALFCSNNSLTYLPVLPDTLEVLLSNNNMLPPARLPKTLKHFRWSISYRNKNNQIEGECLDYALIK